MFHIIRKVLFVPKRFYRFTSSLKSEENVYQSVRKCIVHNENDGFTIKSPYEQINMPEVTIDRYIWQNFLKWENHVAIECSLTGKKFTYAQLRDHCSALAIKLRTQLNLRQNDIAAICLSNVPEYPIAFLGSIEGGLAVTTINPGYTVEEILRQIVNCKPKIFFCLSKNYDVIKESCSMAKIDAKIVVLKSGTNPLPNGAINFQEIMNTRGLNLSESSKYNDHADLDDMIFLPYSSGTTGLSKGVMHSHRTTVANSEVLNTKLFKEPFIYPTTEQHQDVLPSYLPFFHIYGLILSMVNKLALGCKLISMESFSQNHFLDVLCKHRITFLALVPSILLNLGSCSTVKPLHFQFVRHIVCGGACLSQKDVEGFMSNALNSKFTQGFGMTEGRFASSSSDIKNYGTIGWPLPNTELKIVKVDDDGYKGLAVNQQGELLARGPTVMKGYFNNDETTKDTITKDGWLRTGDIGYYDENGSFYINDRLKELIKVNAYQVAPAEIEFILREHPDVLDAVVIGIPDPKYGEVPKAFVVRRPLSNTTESDLQKFVAKQLIKFKHLSGGVRFIENIPKSSSGKVLRREIKRLYS